MMQTYCGFTDCIGNSPENGFSFSKLLESWVSYMFSILHSYFRYTPLYFKDSTRH